MGLGNWMSQIPDTKYLRQIVMPGSHDAGVYGTVQTIIRGAGVKKSYTVCQHSDFFMQAASGSRFFDCRVFRRSTGGGQSENRLGHFAMEKVKGSSQPTLGGYGGALSAVVGQALEFVLANPTEFVILRFSHTYHPTDCVNEIYQVIASKPAYNGAVYRQTGNIATKSIGQLRGNVIMVFDEQFNHHITPGQGIHRFKKFTDGLSHIDGLSTCGTFASSLKMSDVHKGAMKGVDKHMDHPTDPAVGHLHFVYWQQTGSTFGEKDVQKTTSKSKTPGKDWSGGAHANLSDFVTELNQARTQKGRLPANVISHDFVSGETCTKIIKMNPEYAGAAAI
jgi:hypothetical protein